MSQLSIYRGDTKTYSLTFTDADNAAIDITGWTIFFTVKEKKSDADDDAVLKKDVTVHGDPTNGLSSIALSATDTDISPSRYYYDIQIKKDDDSINTVLCSTFEVLTDITRRTS